MAEENANEMQCATAEDGARARRGRCNGKPASWSGNPVTHYVACWDTAHGGAIKLCHSFGPLLVGVSPHSRRHMVPEQSCRQPQYPHKPRRPLWKDSSQKDHKWLKTSHRTGKENCQRLEKALHGSRGTRETKLGKTEGTNTPTRRRTRRPASV